MKNLFLFFLLCSIGILAQEDNQATGTNIQTYTPSKLLSQGQWDIKWFNNLYTETKGVDEHGNSSSFPRQNFFTASLDVFTGASKNNRVNIGILLEYRSNTTRGLDAFAPLDFKKQTYKRSGLSSIAPAIKFVPFPKLNRFAIQTSLSFPLFQKEVEEGVFLDQKGYTFQNRFFFDYLAPNGAIQIYSELNTELNFGDNAESFANDSLRISPGIFVSYFPRPNTTVLGLVQHAELIEIQDSLNQRFTSVGGGIKHQLTSLLNLELLYTKFISGKSTGLGQTFNLGLRAVFN